MKRVRWSPFVKDAHTYTAYITITERQTADSQQANCDQNCTHY